MQNTKGIIIDAGHGGTDPGAMGNGIIEKDLNLDISQYMYDRFNQLNVPVEMTRKNDEALILEDRIEKAKEAFGDKSGVILISNHINAGGGDGAEVIYALRNTPRLSDLILSEIEKKGQNIRGSYQRRLPSDLTKDYYFLHRNTTNMEPVIVEYGFIDGDDDPNQLKNNWKEYAEAVVKAVMEYKGLPYSPPNGVNTGTTYTVQKGDTLYAIANKYGMTVEALKRANGLTSDVLYIGQNLIIPNGVSELNYTVERGDTLYSIAHRYGITVEALKRANGLTSDVLSIGQNLIIPNGVSELNYTVERGDTLYSIAHRYGTTVDAIIKLNGLTTSLLYVGQILKIPQ